MKNKIAWVFGSSAVGKETFIRDIVKKRLFEVSDRLDWNNKQIIPCEESMSWVVQEDGDGHEQRREDLVDLVINYTKAPDSVVLVKGQDLDLEADRLRKLKEKLPNCEHEIVYLYIDLSILYERYKRKKWWTEKLTKEVCKEWLQKQVEMLEEFRGDFKITALESDDNRKYKNIDFPPLI